MPDETDITVEEAQAMWDKATPVDLYSPFWVRVTSGTLGHATLTWAVNVTAVPHTSVAKAS